MGKKKLEFPKYFYEAVSIAAGLAILAYNYLFCLGNDAVSGPLL